MKRELFKNVSVIAAANGKVIDREGFLSAVLAVSVGTITGEPDKAVLTVKVEHSDTETGTFTEVGDTMLNPEQAAKAGGVPDVEITSGEELKIDLDLLGCKRFVKLSPEITFTGGTTPKADDAAYAVVLGDPAAAPVA